MQILFVRDFVATQGGHLKVLHYLRHTAASGAVPFLYLTPRSRGALDNIFDEYDGERIERLRPFPAYFLAGEDWFLLDQAGINPGSAPVVNLIQGFRHADPSALLFSCLKRPALRICVSFPVADAIRGAANGDVHVIENGTDLQPAGVPPANPRRVLIAGLKNPGVAREVASRIEAFADVDLLTEQIPRSAFVARISQASICIMLPLVLEGFFLPPLEAMALGRAVITPACGGNLSYCLSMINCLMPDYDATALAEAARLLIDSPDLRRDIVAGGLSTAAQRSLEAERAAYHAILKTYILGPGADDE
jgi:glycosyltransferase involved in cell wall biosynthesis